MALKEQLTKLILEQRTFEIDKIDAYGDKMKVEELEKNSLYKLLGTNIFIKFTEIEKDMIYDFYIVTDEQESYRLGTTYNIDDNIWIAKNDIGMINKEGKTMLDSVITFLSVEGII